MKKFMIGATILLLYAAAGLSAATFSYQASSPDCAIYPTVNNCNSQIMPQSIGAYSFKTPTYITTTRLMLTSTEGPSSIWTNVPFTVDLVIQDTTSKKFGLFTIMCIVNGETKYNSSTLTVSVVSVYPESQKIGSFIYKLSTAYSTAPCASGHLYKPGPAGLVQFRIDSTPAPMLYQPMFDNLNL